MKYSISFISEITSKVLIQISEGKASLIEGECTMVRGVGMSNWNAMPSQKVVDEFEDGDPRLYQTFWTKGGDRFTDVDGISKPMRNTFPNCMME